MQTIWAEQALTAEGWRHQVKLTINDAGQIDSLEDNSKPEGYQVGALLPSPANLHSHALQRAMAGLTESRSSSNDSFWTWRELMYQFVGQLTPDDVEAIAAFVQMEMLEAGFASIGEFHYLHHQPGGQRYDNMAEMSCRIMAASATSGIGLTLLPVLYQQSGCNGQALAQRQTRFGNTIEQFAQLIDQAQQAMQTLTHDSCLGVAPHSLRAVNQPSLAEVTTLLPNGPIHIHIAEQLAEVEEVQAHYFKRPVEWLLDNHSVDKRWCLIHATHMNQQEIQGLASSGAVAGLCPITEANLGDGIFSAVNYCQQGGRFGIGSDSNIRISLTEELRILEYSQRLRDYQRTSLATADKSTGRQLLEQAALGGAQATGRHSGCIQTGYLADLVALNTHDINLIDKKDDILLDSYIFAGDDRLVSDVWSAGRHLVSEGLHKHHQVISQRFCETMMSLGKRL